MRKIVMFGGIAAAALLATPSANAAGAVSSPAAQVQNDNATATDVSARRRHYHRRYVRHYRPYYAPSYAYYPPAYYSPGPSISFRFGGGGYGGGYRHGGWGHRW